LRPQQVLDAMQEYYQQYNACGGRVKYDWGRKVDEKVAATRKNILKFLGKSEKEYACAFTLNTTYGLNLLMSQLPKNRYSQITTSDIEHNSVFLPAITTSKRLGISRNLLERSADGSLQYNDNDIENAVVFLNTTSNIDGRNLLNAKKLTEDTHAKGGIVILDGAQSMAHNPEVLENVDYDAVCFAGHKMYGPSIGIMVVKKSLVKQLDLYMLGGGTVQDVQRDDYTLIQDDVGSHLELGLQDFAGIIGLNAALEWMPKYKPEGKNWREQQEGLAKQLFEGLSEIPSVRLLNEQPSTITSFYSEKIDAHRLAIFISAQGMMARSGYFCCHYYLDASKKLPPMLRLSLGLNNTEAQIEKVVDTIKTIIERS
jgi:selenocysteine lyase/cysteine desulfurase